MQRAALPSAVAAIVFDAAANSGDQAAVSSVSVSAVWSGNNRMLAIDVAFMGAAGSVSSITYGGAACTLVGAQSVVGGTGRIEQWRIIQSDSSAPAAGSNTLVVTYSGVIADTSVSWVSYTNVHQTTPTEAWNGNSGINAGSPTDATVVVTPVADLDWCHFAMATSQTSGIASSNTSRNIVTGAGGTGADSDTGTFVSPASAQTGRWTGNGITSAWAAAGYAIRPLSASGVNNYNRTASDSPQTTDALSRIETLTRALSDAPVTSDTLVRLETLARSLADAPQTASTLARIETLVRSLTDNPQTSDTIARLLVLLRSLSDIPTTADSLARAGITFPRTASDAPQTTDTLARTVVLSRAASDAPTTADSLARAEVLTRALVDAPQTTSPLTRTQVITRAAADAPQTADSLSRIETLNRTVADAPQTVDVLTRTIVLSRIVVDAPTVVGALARTQILHRTLGDTPQTTDQLTNSGATFLLADSPHTSDTLSVSLLLFRSVSDTPTTADSLARTETLVRAGADAPTTTDSITRVQILSRAAVDNAQVVDVLVVSSQVLHRTLDDSPIVIESVTRTLVLSRSAEDIPHTTDELTGPVATPEAGVDCQYRYRYVVESYFLPGRFSRNPQNSDVGQVASVTPAQIIRSCLIDFGIVSYPGRANPKLFICYAFSMPDAADNAVCVFDFAGTSFGRHARTGKSNTHPGVTIKVRSKDEATGYLLANKIGSSFDQQTFPRTTQVPDDGSLHYLANVYRLTPLTFLGEEVGRKRNLWTLDVRVAFEYDEPSLG